MDAYVFIIALCSDARLSVEEVGIGRQPASS